MMWKLGCYGPCMLGSHHFNYDWSMLIKDTVLSLISAPCACQITSQWSIGLEQVHSFPTVVSDWKSDYFWRSYGHLCKKMFEVLQNWPYLCQKWSDFQSETTVGKPRTSPISSQKHGGALIRAGALNGDNTVDRHPLINVNACDAIVDVPSL